MLSSRMSGRPLRRAREAQMLANGGVVPLDLVGIARFTDEVLMPQVRDFMGAQEALNVPIGVHRGIARGVLKHVDPRDGQVKQIRVRLDSSDRDSGSLVSGGTYYHRGDKITGALNGRGRPWDYEQAGYLPFRTQLYDFLIHEMTHFYDARYPQPRAHVYARSESGDMVTDEHGNPRVGDWDAYYAMPTEVRAYMQQVVAQAVRAAKDPQVRRYATTDEDPNRYLVNASLAQSPEWLRAGLRMTEANQRRILQAVYREFDRQGLLIE